MVEASVGELLRDSAIRVMDYPAADAQVDVSPVLHHVVLPRGPRSFLDDLAPRNIGLVASMASLVVRQCHPAITYLLLRAMRRVHSKPAMFT